MLYERNNYLLFKLLINLEESCNCREELILLRGTYIIKLFTSALESTFPGFLVLV